MRELLDAMRQFATAKHLALAAGVHPDTAKRYRAGSLPGDWATLIRLMSASRDIRNAVLHAAGCDDVTLELETIRLTRLLADLQEQRSALYDELYPKAAAVAGKDAGAGVAMADAAQTQRGLKP